jgi:hypothetical protein
MKTVIIELIIILLFTEGCALFVNGKNKDLNESDLSMELSEVAINNSKIDSLINIVVYDNQNYLNFGDCFLLMEYFQGDNDTNYVSIMFYEKAKFTITCPKNEYPILGYFEVNNQIVLVVGDTCFDEMRFLDKKEIFTFKCRKIWKQGTVPSPPSMYNPPFYTFSYKR